jgi:hypothetical protein
MASELTALVCAKSLGMGDTLFRYLPVGALFRFSAVTFLTYRKRDNRGWYMCMDSPAVFRTSLNTAVFSVKES